jgi:hypothetical protein
LAIDPDYAEEIKDDLIFPPESFASLAKDSEFKTVIASSLLKAARKEAESYRRELKDSKKEKSLDSESRIRALKLLADAQEFDAEQTREALGLTKRGESFESLVNDEDFAKLVQESEA